MIACLFMKVLKMRECFVGSVIKWSMDYRVCALVLVFSQPIYDLYRRLAIWHEHDVCRL